MIRAVLSIFLGSFLIVTLPAFAQTPGNEGTGSVMIQPISAVATPVDSIAIRKEGAKMWARIAFDSGRYEGDMQNGMHHGLGKMEWNNCDLYIGQFDNGKQTGKGMMYYANGDSYDGEWKDGQQNGMGTFSWPTGSRYVGHFADNQMHGKGTCYWPNKERYEGHYVKNTRTGHGIYYWENGDRYEGNFVNNVRTGKGTYYYKKGSKYVGNWKNDMKNGKGTFTWPNLDKYEGNFVNDIRSGYGIYTIAPHKNGIFVKRCRKAKVYKGDWENGKKNGWGKCYNGDGGLIYSGPFKDDRPVKRYPGVHSKSTDSDEP